MLPGATLEQYTPYRYLQLLSNIVKVLAKTFATLIRTNLKCSTFMARSSLNFVSYRVKAALARIPHICESFITESLKTSNRC